MALKQDVSAPRKAPVATEATVRRLLRKHPLDKIEITINLHLVAARAHPMGDHPMVTTRRNQWIAERGGSIGMDQLEACTEFTMRPVATASGATIEEALARLERTLGEQRG